jgi:hypothetical protein
MGMDDHQKNFIFIIEMMNDNDWEKTSSTHGGPTDEINS